MRVYHPATPERRAICVAAPRLAKVGEGAAGSPAPGEFPHGWKRTVFGAGKLVVLYVLTLTALLGKGFHFSESVSSSGKYRWQHQTVVPTPMPGCPQDS